MIIVALNKIIRIHHRRGKLQPDGSEFQQGSRLAGYISLSYIMDWLMMDILSLFRGMFVEHNYVIEFLISWV